MDSMNSDGWEILRDDRENGGTCIMMFYFDKHWKASNKEDSSRAIRLEVDKDGEMVSENFLFRKRPEPSSGEE